MIGSVTGFVERYELTTMLVSSGSSASASARIRIEPKIISGSQPSTLRTPILIPSARSDTTCYSQFEPARNFVTGKAATPRLVAGQTRMSHRISNDTPRKLPADSSSQCSQSRSCLKDPPGRDRAADGPEWDAPLPRLNDLLFALSDPLLGLVCARLTAAARHLEGHGFA